MDKRGCSGQVTIFLSLVLILVMSIIFTCLESARSQALRMRFAVVTRLATESVFAAYDRELWEQFGLLYCETDDTAGLGMSLDAYSYMHKNTV